jgi:hypothetical protein
MVFYYGAQIYYSSLVLKNLEVGSHSVIEGRVSATPGESQNRENMIGPQSGLVYLEIIQRNFCLSRTPDLSVLILSSKLKMK